jgi:nucleoside-diphosphate-sugar epimerase
MKWTDINGDESLWQCMTEPGPGLLSDLLKIEGPVMVLGGSGKMGKDLVGMLRRADRELGIQRGITVASTFGDRSALHLFQRLGVSCLQGDLADPDFIDRLPPAPNVLYMMGFKFGSSGDWRRAFHLNSIVPYLVGRRYADARIVVFSSGNPYPHTAAGGPGCAEDAELDPVGVYGWSIVARESAFRTTALQHPAQKLCLYRLMYAQHLSYGVLVDLASMIAQDEPISLSMPAVNLISQRDANDVALRCLLHCENPATVINVAGPALPVRQIARQLGRYMGKEVMFEGPEPETALLADDARCRSLFGSYRDQVEEMLPAAARWVMRGGTTWQKPTHFGKVRHDY